MKIATLLMAFGLALFSCTHDEAPLEPFVHYPEVTEEVNAYYQSSTVNYTVNEENNSFIYIPDPVDDFRFYYGIYYVPFAHTYGGIVNLFHHEVLLCSSRFISMGEEYHPEATSWYIWDFENENFPVEGIGYKTIDSSKYLVIRDWPYSAENFDTLEVTAVLNKFIVEE